MMIPIMFIVSMLIIITLSIALITSWLKPKKIHQLIIRVSDGRSTYMVNYHFRYASDCILHEKELRVGDYSWFNQDIFGAIMESSGPVKYQVSLADLLESEYSIVDFTTLYNKPLY